MALTSIAFSTALLIIAAPPFQGSTLCPEEECADSRFGFDFPSETMMRAEVHNDLALDGKVTGFVGGLVQHMAPTVVLFDGNVRHFDPTPQAFSTDVPEFWTPVRYGPLAIQVRVLGTVDMLQAMEHVVLLLDNRPLQPPHDLLSSELSPVFETGLFQASYRYTLSCPAPGKHILRARYQVGGLWSRLSAPLHFNVRLPDPPRIIGISESSGNPLPIRSGRTISVTEPSLRLQLAQITCNSTIIAYLNGKPIKTGKSDGSCCRSGTNQSQASAAPSNKADACCCRIVKLEGHITPGVHRLTVRTVHEQSNPFIASEFSNEVVFHYYDEDVYLLRPGRHSGNRCCPCRHPAACMAPETPSSSHSRHSRPESLPPQPALPSALEGSHLSVAEQSERTVEPRVSFVALQQGGYLEAARIMLAHTKEFRDSAATAVGAAANEALKQRDLAAQHARSAAAHLSDLTVLVRQEEERIQETQPSIEQMEMIGKLGKSVAVLIRQAVDSINEVCDDKLAAIRFAEDLEELAEREEAKADAWIRAVEAESRIDRAAAITGPPSPFYFAAPAHFPIRGFGAGGAVIERPGAVIYEDMVFSFDRDGNYHLRFSILIPDLPTTLHLQLQLQPDPHGPWYTITLPPQQFRPEESRYGRPQPRVIQDHVIRGRSEILHRCYGEMGENATIRRTGSARFGYGFDAMRQATAH